MWLFYAKLSWYLHCVKSARIRSHSGPHFPAFGLNVERYSDQNVMIFTDHNGLIFLVSNMCNGNIGLLNIKNYAWRPKPLWILLIFLVSNVHIYNGFIRTFLAQKSKSLWLLSIFLVWFFGPKLSCYMLLTSSYGLGILQIKFFSVTSSVHKIVRHYIANAANAVRSLTFVWLLCRH